MDADDAVDILDNVSEEERQALISHMEKDAKGRCMPDLFI